MISIPSTVVATEEIFVPHASVAPSDFFIFMPCEQGMRNEYPPASAIRHVNDVICPEFRDVADGTND